ncbi:MAG TPA: ABC transporter permease [Ktedonobacterales bacterium]|jgi:ABC-2 type transport system permease protein
MRLRPILAIARKDALDLVLNKSTLAVLLIPLLVAVLFALLGAALTPRPASLLIYNPGGSAVEQVLRAAFTDAQVTRASSAEQVRRAFPANASHLTLPYTAGLVVPFDFEASLRAGEQTSLELYVAGDQVSSQERQLLERALSEYSRSVVSPASPVQITAVSVDPPGAVPPGSQFGALYTLLSLLTAMVVGTSLVPNLLIEEKEQRTLRMLLVSPASLADVVAGKLLVGLAYQLLLGLVTLAVQRAFVGQAPLVVLFLLAGSCLGIALGLLVGSLFNTTSAGGAFTGMVALFYLFPALFVGPISQFVQSSALKQIIQFLPSYYLASGLFAALENQATFAAACLDLGAVLLTAIALFLLAVWVLWRRARILGQA